MEDFAVAALIGLSISAASWITLLDLSFSPSRILLVSLILVWTLLAPALLLSHPKFETAWKSPEVSSLKLISVAVGVFFILLFLLTQGKPVFGLRSIKVQRQVFTFLILTALFVNIVEAVKDKSTFVI